MEVHSNHEKSITSLFERNESQTGSSIDDEWQAGAILLFYWYDKEANFFGFLEFHLNDQNSAYGY